MPVRKLLRTTTALVSKGRTSFTNQYQ